MGNKDKKLFDTFQKAQKCLTETKRKLVRINPKRIRNAVINELDSVELFYGYSEPGYPSDVIVALGNWNEIRMYDENHLQKHKTNLLSELLELFENLGIECEWNDEWIACDCCGKLVRIQPDSYSWTASFIEFEGEMLCEKCIVDNPADYLESLEGETNNALTLNSIDLEKYGYKFVDSFESGLYPGQNDSPEELAGLLKKNDIYRFLFKIDAVGQFDTDWSLYIHEDEYKEAIRLF